MSVAEVVPAGYKKTEVGVIPDDWNCVTVAKVADVRGGKRLPAGYRLQDHRTAHPYVRVADMTATGIATGDIRYVPEAAANVIQNYRISVDDIYISVAGTLGLVGVIPDELDGANLTENADKLTNITCDKDYLTYWLRSSFIQRRIDAIRTIGAQPKLALGRIAKFNVALPSQQYEQRAIADALGDVDALLDALNRLITKKRDLKQAAMQQLLTARTRLPGFTDKWCLTRLGDHLRFLKHGTNSRAELTIKGTVRYLHYGDIHGAAGSMLNPAVSKLPCLSEPKARALDRLRDGDLVFADASEDIEGVGRSVELHGIGNSEMVAGMHTIAVRFDNVVLADGFKGYLQFLPAFRDHLQRLAAGTKVYATNRAYIANAELALPSIDEQTAIATILTDMDAEITTLEARRAKTTNLKQAMMQELLTGRTRLI